MFPLPPLAHKRPRRARPRLWAVLSGTDFARHGEERHFGWPGRPGPAVEGSCALREWNQPSWEKNNNTTSHSEVTQSPKTRFRLEPMGLWQRFFQIC